MKAPLRSVTERHSHDHIRLSGLLLRFESLNETDLVAANSLFNEIRSDLERHIRWEEEILFPIFEKGPGMRDGEPTVVMRQEHRQIKDFLDHIQAALVQQWPAPIADILALQDLFLQHNQKEEHLVFPVLDSLSDQTEHANVFVATESCPDGASRPAHV
ncbi:MAG: hemerythrin domain-containing protein [Verrucomicrobia bacterium]|nr:hemerythrin domain-containing protein [Verrucomicrobiota bacterium]MDE3100279.1 hemerythrin domain-containing protein [Verrucomicrobiota bacterium]